MTSLLLAVALAQQAPAGTEWGPKPPYKDSETTRYAVKMQIENPADGTYVPVEMTANVKFTKKTEKGFDGTFGWTQLVVDGADQPDEEFKVSVKPNGTLRSVDSDFGPGMRRMFLPFYFIYPEKPLVPGGSWTYKDTKEEEVDGHTTDFTYKLEGTEMYKSKKAQKVAVKFNEVGPNPLKGDGTYWLDEEGRVVKFELKVTGWPVPYVGEIFTATISGEIAG